MSKGLAPTRDFILETRVNGDAQRELVPAHRTLLEYLREDLDLTGSKHGCDVGDCGACTVRVNGKLRLACITLAAEAHGGQVETIEGLAADGELHPVQSCIDKHVAAQCGYCTPGIAMALAHALEEDPRVDEERLRTVLSSNICRCTGYTKILLAAEEAAQQMLASRGEEGK